MQNKSLRRKKTEPSKQNPELNIFKLTDYLAILFLEVYPEILLGLIYIKMSKKKKELFFTSHFVFLKKENICREFQLTLFGRPRLSKAL